MKRQLLLLTALLLTAISSKAQQTWVFTSTPESDVAALAAATSDWSYTESSKRYESKKAIDGAIKAGSTELTMTKGLKVKAAEKKIRIDVDNRLQLAGKNVVVTIPSLKKGQVLTVSMASTGDTQVTFDQLTNLSGTSGFTAADKNTKQTGTGTVTVDGDVTMACSVGSINIFSISVNAAPQTGGDDFNKAIITLDDNTLKTYNTANIASIDIYAKGKVTIGNEVFGNVQKIHFQKKQQTTPDDPTPGPGDDLTPGPGDDPTPGPGDDPTPTPTPDPDPTPGEIINGDLKITESNGWLESVYAKWEPLEGAKTYNVYVKGGQYTDFTKIDQQLVRNYGTYGRADVVGLKAGSYELKVVPVNSAGEEQASKGSSVSGLTVKNYDRAGYAHFGYNEGIGAYNNDGTLKQGAKVLYVTKNTAKTITTTVVTDSKGGTTKCTGLQAIITGYEKGCDTTPITFRFIGLVTKNDLDAIGSKEEGLQVKGRNGHSVMNITFEGIGNDATIKGFGFLVRNCRSVEFRNLGLVQFMDDGISLDTDNSHVWLHNIDVFYGQKGSAADQRKGDGSIDIKGNSQYVTVDNCHFWDSGKSSMCGMKDDSDDNWITYHSNWFDHSDSRHARVRRMSVHIYNNFFDNVAKYGVGATKGSSVFVENNYFLKTKKPILTSKQGTDAQGTGTFSGEDGGMIKSYGNYLDSSISNFKYYTQKNATSTGYDAYETATRNDQVPNTEKALQGGSTYNNFDTDATKIYEYTPLAATDVPGKVKGYYGAGRLNHGDISYTFTDNVGNDDTDSAIDTALENILKNYKSSLVGIFGDENADSGEQGGELPGGGDEPGGDEPGGEVTPSVDGNILCTFDQSGNPSSTLFTVIGNGSNSKGSATIDGTEYKTCLKMESSTSVKFTLTQKMTMTLYFASTETASIKIDGTKISGSGNTYTTTLEAGSHELTKDKSVNLFGIKLIPATD